MTADPAEGEGFTAAGNDLVDYVPMPDAVREHGRSLRRRAPCRDSRIYKRERTRADPEALARRGPRREGHDE